MSWNRVIGVLLSIALIASLFTSLVAPAAADRPGGAGKPAATGKPDGVGKPEEAGKPEGAGKPDDVGKPEEAGKPEGVGKPEDVGKPEGDTLRYRNTGRSPDGELWERLQMWCQGLHMVVTTDDPEEAGADFCPTEEVLDAMVDLVPGAVITSTLLVDYVELLETAMESGALEKFNFYGPLSWLNQLRAVEPEEEE